MARRASSLLCAALIVLASTGAVVGTAGATPPASAADGNETRVAPPADPDEDVLGWENGVWYNESIAVDQSDDLDESELAALLNRSMARVEEIRRLEFRRTPDVTFLTRGEYRDLINRSFAGANVTRADRLHQNTKFEALFLVGQETPYFDVARQNQGAFAKAFFVTRDAPDLNLSEGDIGIILDDGSLPKLNETTLAHELAHAVQNQHFDTSRYESDTEDDVRAIDGLVEGDAHYVEALYGRRCADNWSCATARTGAAGGSQFGNLGLVLYQLVPYGDGPAFVRQIKRQGGWEAVNALYENPPTTSEQVIHPEKYPDEVARNLTVADRSTDEWHVLELEGGINYATFGEAGLFTMLWYPSYLQRGDVIVPLSAPFTESSVAPYDFASRYTDGWDGDKLYPYVTDGSNETGYVWKLAWDTESDAEEFLGAYERLLEYWDGERVGRHTYRIPPSDRAKTFTGAIHAERTGSTVLVVKAPTVDQLPSIRSDVTVEEVTPTPEPTPTPTPESTPTPTATPAPSSPSTATPGSAATPTATRAESPTPAGTTSASASGPGFGPAVGLLAVVLAGLVAARRTR